MYPYGVYEACCGNPSHGKKCRKIATAKRSKCARLLTLPTQGKAVGFLMAWLTDGYDEPADKHLQLQPSFHQRCEGRRELKSMDGEQPRRLIDGEQQGTASDSDEPEIPPAAYSFM